MQLKSAKHKAIKAMLAGNNRPKGLGPRDAARIEQQLLMLAAAVSLEQVARSYPGWNLHPLQGPLAGNWSLDVTGNWRLIFRMDEPGVITDLDYRDTH